MEQTESENVSDTNSESESTATSAGDWQIDNISRQPIT